MTTEHKRNLFNGAAALAACAFTMTGKTLMDADSFTLLSGLAINVASSSGLESCMRFITKKWLSHPDKVVNHHIQRALVAAINTALTEIKQEYLIRDDVSPREQQSLRDFFAILRSRSEQEFMEATRDELTKPEILDYVYDRAGARAHLHNRLRIQIDPLADDYYFTQRFLDYFPDRFTGLVQFHFRELLKKGEEAKQAMDLLFFETLHSGLNELKIGQTDLKTGLDAALETGTRTAQQLDFYGEIWISAIRQNRAQLDQIEENTQKTLQEIGYLRADVANKDDINALRRDISAMYRQPVQPGLLGSPQFQQLNQTLRDTEQAFVNARSGLIALETTIAQNPALTVSLTLPLGQAQQLTTATDAQQQQARQNLIQFIADVAATQRAIMDATSHRADVARQLFEQGRFAEANAALSADELRRDKTDLLQQLDAVRAQLEQLAQDFILKANMIVLVKEPDWFTQARQLFEEGVETDKTYYTCVELGYFLQQHNQHLDAMVWYANALPLSTDESQKSLLLNNLAILYQVTSRFEQAEGAYNEALEIRRGLAKVNPATYLPDVATTLNNLAVLYKDTSRFKQAEGVYDEALEIQRGLVKVNPATYSPDVAMTLNNLAGVYQDTSRFEQAEGAYDEALEIQRGLAKVNPATYLPDVATTLNNLGILYKDTSRFEQAEGAYDEALEIRRGLAKVNPATYLPGVATTLNNLGILYQVTSRFEQAEGAYDEALEIRRGLAKVNPATYLPDVAKTLNNLAILYKDTSRFKQAEGVYDEALEIRRGLAEVNPATYLPGVATTLNNLADLYKDTSRFEQAEGAYDEALEIRRGLAKVNPATYLPDVAKTLNNLAILYQVTSRFKQAEGAYDEALEIRRGLAKVNPATYLPDVAMTLNNLAGVYQDTSRFEQAEGAYDEALEIQRGVAKVNPATYLPDVAKTLNNLAILYQVTSRFKQAEGAYDEALEIQRGLAKVNPATYLPGVATTLNNLAVLYKDTSRFKQAEGVYDEALEIRRGLAKVNPDIYSIDAAMTAVNMSMLYRNQPTPNQDQSVDYALLTLFYAISYHERVPLALKIFQTAIEICGHWGIDWQAEYQKKFGS